ncbi:MAG: GH1 family beta-glucosidase [Ilumatobacteraceae bacterium]
MATVDAASESASSASLRFPAQFVWGAATSSYQIEGATEADGRGDSIWDRFCRLPGRIADGSDGAVACDHFHRWRDDIGMMSALGLTGYRFSVAWPRVMPDGRGRVNSRGLDFYERLVDALLDAGITPYPTLYHWDLPQALEDRGGWTARSTAVAFAEYTEAVVDRLGDRVQDWMTINEPYVVANHGYLTGEHAPGRRSVAESLAASHHLLLAHGLALDRIRRVVPAARAGIVLNFTPVTPVGTSSEAVDRQRLADELENRWFIDPIIGRGYPTWAAERLGWDRTEVLLGDLELIAAPIDVLGINFYTRQQVGAFDGERAELPEAETAMGWEVHPASLGSLLHELHERCAFPRYLITENGAAMPDDDRVDGAIVDHDRIDYLAAHLDQVHRAITAGMPIEGYFVWSLLDNFEWAHGYGPSFGIVEVDFETQQRIPKASAHWYSQVARTNTLPPPAFAELGGAHGIARSAMAELHGG